MQCTKVIFTPGSEASWISNWQQVDVTIDFVLVVHISRGPKAH